MNDGFHSPKKWRLEVCMQRGMCAYMLSASAAAGQWECVYWLWWWLWTERGRNWKRKLFYFWEEEGTKRVKVRERIRMRSRALISKKLLTVFITLAASLLTCDTLTLASQHTAYTQSQVTPLYWKSYIFTEYAYMHTTFFSVTWVQFCTVMSLASVLASWSIKGQVKRV